jgi:hypothetical protein
MKTFKLTAKFTISGYTEVNADSIEEAIEIANDRDKMALIQDGSSPVDENWLFDEIDGEAFNISEEN